MSFNQHALILLAAGAALEYFVGVFSRFLPRAATADSKVVATEKAAAAVKV